jgi:hypothetical protein
VDDSLETDAEKMADAAVQSPATDAALSPLHSGRGTTGGFRWAPASVERALAADGQALDPATRGYFEHRMHWDFSRVRIHDDQPAAESAHSIGASAYTAGSHIVFGRAQYAPGTNAGRRLIAHELAHVVQQTSGTAVPAIQRQAVPPEKFAELIAEIDEKLADPKLSDEERLKLLKQRHEHYEYLRGLTASARFTPPTFPKATPRMQPQTAPVITPPSPAPPPPSPASGKLKSTPSTGTAGGKAASARARADSQGGTSGAPPPSTPYVEPVTRPANPEEAAKRAEESGIGAQLNARAVARSLGEIRRVRGLDPVPGQSSPDYAFDVKGNDNPVYGDLYSPAPGTPVDNVVAKVIEKKSAQGEILVLHLTGIKKPLEYAQHVAEALIVTPNHGLRQVIAFSNQKFLMMRSLTVDAKVLPKIRQNVIARREQERQTETVVAPEWAKAQKEQRAQEPPKLTPEQVAKVQTARAQLGIKSLMEAHEEGEEGRGLLYDPRAVEPLPRSGTGLSTQGAVEGAGQIFLSEELSSARDYQLRRALDAWDALQPDIAKLRSDGFDVTVTAVAQVPKQPDIAGYVTGVGDTGQVVYFEKMYIARFSPARKPGSPTSPPNEPAHMDSVSPEDSARLDKYGSKDRYDEPRWIEEMQKTYEMYGRAGSYKPPKPGFRFEVRDLTLPAHP